MLLLEDDRTLVVDAVEYWGKGIEEATRLIQDARYQWRNQNTLVIGPAGENLVKYAMILNETHHTFGRAGFGAIMGSKNLKAVVVKAKNRSMSVADPERYEALRKGTQRQDQGGSGF